MSRNEFPVTKLAPYADGTATLSGDDLTEMAAFGGLVDWELAKFFTRAGWTMLSQSYRFKDEEVLMVVKLLVDGAQYVVFVSGPSPIYCMRSLVRKANSKSLALYPDRYA